jgi:hypothetical protein
VRIVARNDLLQHDRISGGAWGGQEEGDDRERGAGHVFLLGR